MTWLERIKIERPPVNWRLVDLNGPYVIAWHRMDAHGFGMCGIQVSPRHLRAAWDGVGSPPVDAPICNLCLLVPS